MAGLDQFKIEVKFVRRAKRATLRVKPGFLIKLSLPYGVKRAQIEEWIHSKTKWILEKHEMLESQTQTPLVQFKEGAEVPFAGAALKLVRSQTVKWVELKGSDLLVPEKYFKTEESVRRSVLKWYQDQALEGALSRVEHYSQQLGVKAKWFGLKNYRSGWGACSSKGELIFNWQIILLKKEMFEYVVAHEVCHLVEMNHSQRFYTLLAKLGFDKSEMHRQFKHLKNLL